MIDDSKEFTEFTEAFLRSKDHTGKRCCYFFIAGIISSILGLIFSLCKLYYGGSVPEVAGFLILSIICVVGIIGFYTLFILYFEGTARIQLLKERYGQDTTSIP